MEDVCFVGGMRRDGSLCSAKQMSVGFVRGTVSTSTFLDGPGRRGTVLGLLGAGDVVL